MPPPFPSNSFLVAYIRDSGGETQELSHDQQEQEIRRWCKKHGYTLTRIFRDVGTGTSTENRHQFHQMIRYFRENASEAGIILWRFNRFARDVNDAQFYRADLRRRGYIVHSIKDDIPTGNYQHIFEAITDTLAQQHSEELSEDVKRGQHHLVESYGALGGTPPRGFKREPVQISTHRNGKAHITHKWVPDPALAPIVKKAWRMRANGESYASIKRETGLYKSINSYTTFFRNKLYIGTLEFGDLVIEDYCEPIVSRKTWNAVQKINNENERIIQEMHPRRENSSYLLTGLLHCGKCGSPYNGLMIPSRDGTTYHYYRCSRSHRNRDCSAPNLNKEEIEHIILEELTNQILKPDYLKLLQDQEVKNRRDNRSTKEAEIEAFQKELKSISRKIDNVTLAIAEHGHSQALLQRLNNLEAEKSNFKSRISELKEGLEPLGALPDPEIVGSTLKKALENASREEKQTILRGLIQRIDALRDKKAKKITGTITLYLPTSLLDKKKAPREEELRQKIYVYVWCPHGDSNPGLSLERAMSWAARRWGHSGDYSIMQGRVRQ